MDYFFSSFNNSNNIVCACGFSTTNCRIESAVFSTSCIAISVIGCPHFEQKEDVGALM